MCQWFIEMKMYFWCKYTCTYACRVFQYDGIPHQVVTPYKPHEDTSVDMETRSCSDRAPLLQSSHSTSSNGQYNWESQLWIRREFHHKTVKRLPYESNSYLPPVELSCLSGLQHAVTNCLAEMILYYKQIGGLKIHSEMSLGVKLKSKVIAGQNRYFGLFWL